ncbi:MAG: aminotransferase class V-fold PLP-dependent enzyme [Bacteriovoracaceae bacterium]
MFSDLQIPSELIPSDPRFGCGPSVIPMEHVDALREKGVHLLGTSHRKPAVKNLGSDIQSGLLKYFGLSDDYLVVFGNGGATQAFDAIGLNFVKKKSAHFVTGEFSKKWWMSHDLIPWIETEKLEVEMGQGMTPRMIEGCDLIATTLNETSTGVIVDELPDLDENTLLAIDATSGGGQVACDVKKVDIFFFGPQKVFASEGGLFIAILSPKALKRLDEMGESNKNYIPQMMNFQTLVDNSKKGQVYNTPSVSTMFLLNEQIKKMNERTYEGVIAEGQRRAELLYSWAEEKPYLKPFVEEEKYRSTVVATIDVDEKIPADELVKALESQKIVYDINSYRKLGRNQFRIAMFYNIAYSDLEKLTKLLSHAIESKL